MVAMPSTLPWRRDWPQGSPRHNQTGVGGYGGVLMIAPADGRPPRAIDFNTAAPAAMRADIFQPGPDGKVPGQINDRGWLAAGVPGVLAGLQLALDRYGTRSFRESAQPAIELARQGIVLDKNLASLLRTHAKVLAQDVGSRSFTFATASRWQRATRCVIPNWRNCSAR